MNKGEAAHKTSYTFPSLTLSIMQRYLVDAPEQTYPAPAIAHAQQDERAHSRHSLKGRQLSSKSQAGTITDISTQRGDVANRFSNASNYRTEERYSFRKLAKSFLFNTEEEESMFNYTTCNPPEQAHINKVLQENDSIVNGTIFNTQATHGGVTEKIPDFRIVAITSVPKKLSIPSLLGAVHGGPLEKVELVRKDNYQFYSDAGLYELNQPINWSVVSIFLHFSEYEDANDFYKYSKTGLFKVNDIHLKTVWIPDIEKRTGIDDSGDGGSDNDDYQVISHLMKDEEKARRVLVFKKPLNDKRNKANKRRMGYPDPTVNYSEDFDVEEIKRDFGQYGKLVEVLPVVSRKLCFGLQYYDVRSAIKVKRVIHSPNAHDDEESIDSEYGIDNNLSPQDLEIRRKYKDWYIWYGRDPAEKCVPRV